MRQGAGGGGSTRVLEYASTQVPTYVRTRVRRTYVRTCLRTRVHAEVKSDTYVAVAGTRWLPARLHAVVWWWPARPQTSQTIAPARQAALAKQEGQTSLYAHIAEKSQSQKKSTRP